MDKTQIEDCIQRVLDRRIAGLGEDKSTGKSSFDKHLYNTAYRLSKYIHKYRTRRISQDDLLISLRNYLLLFKTTDNPVDGSIVAVEVAGKLLCRRYLKNGSYIILRREDGKTPDIIRKRCKFKGELVSLVRNFS